MQKSKNHPEFEFQKPHFDTISKVFSTMLGRMHIRGPVSPERMKDYHFSEGLCCFRPHSLQHKSLIELADEPDGLVFVAAVANTVVSYVAFHKPDYPWWRRRCFPQLLELGSIETDPSWRDTTVTQTLLENIFLNENFGFFEDFIVIAVQAVDGWDFKNTGFSPWDYRQMLINLFSKYGFTTWETDDPEVREHPCNLLMARLGRNTDINSIKHFANCCLGTE